MYKIRAKNPFYVTLKILNLTGYYPTRRDKGYLLKFYLLVCFRTILQLIVICGNVTHFFHYIQGKYSEYNIIFENIDV